MDTPVQPAGGEPGVRPAGAGEGAAFLAQILGGGGSAAPAAPVASPAVPQPVAPQAVAQPVAPQPVVPQPVVPQPVVPQPVVQPAAQPVVQPVARPQMPVQPTPPPPPPPPPPVDFSNRYSGQASAPADPLANLQTAPDLTPEVQIAEPQNMSEQQNHAWAAMRAQSNANRRQAEEFRGKYNQLVESTKKFQEERTSFGDQLNAKDKRIADLEDQLGRMDLTRSPAFQQKYDVPIQSLCGEIAQTLEANGRSQQDAADMANEILSVDRNQVPELIAQLPTHVQGLIMVKVEQADKLFGAREAAISDWRSSAEGLAAVQERSDSLVAAQHTGKMVDAALNILRSMPAEIRPPAYQVVDPSFSADRDAQESKFRAWVQQAPEDQKYAAMLEGFMAPKTYEMLRQVMQENQRLKQVLSSHGRLAAPPIAASPAAPVVAPPPRQPTMAQDGFAPAPSGDMAQGFIRGILPGLG